MQSIMSTSTFNNNRHDGDAGDFDLHDSYEAAVKCLIKCEAIINTLESQLAEKEEQISEKDERIVSLEERLPANTNASPQLDGQLAAKDEQIANLEEKLVQMSLELASSKAFEDAHRSNSVEDKSGIKVETRRRRGWQRQQERCSWRSLGSIGSIDKGDDIVDGRKGADGSDSARSFPGLGKIFLGFKEELDNEKIVVSDEVKVDPNGLDNAYVALPKRHPSQRQQKQAQRRAPNLDISIHSSRSFLEGVVFPKSVDDVLNKGCLVQSSRMMMQRSRQPI